jgi:putative transposase
MGNTMNKSSSGRRSMRLPEYDYREMGGYFITLKTYHNQTIFGDIKAGEIILSVPGEIVREEWEKTGRLRQNVQLDAYTIMPDHFHAIVILTELVETPVSSSIPDHTVHLSPGPKPGSIGAIAAQFKSMTTRKINYYRHQPGRPVWQRNYYEHIIRDDKDLSRIRQYILNNPYPWQMNKED